MKPRHDARLVPAAIGAYVVAGSLAASLVHPAWWAAAGVAAALLTLLVRPVRPHGQWWFALAAVIAVTVTTSWHEQVLWSGGIREAMDGREVVVVGQVLREPSATSVAAHGGTERWRVPVRLSAWGAGGATQATRAEVTLVGGDWGVVEYGQTVVARVRLSEGGRGRNVAIAWQAELLMTSEGPRHAQVVAYLRERLRTSASGLPGTVRGLTVGMVIGDTEQMGAAQAADMRVTSLTHLTAVSGAHFAILAIAAGAATRALRWKRPARVVVLAAVMAGFIAVVFPDPSVVRAGWMGAVLALALWWGRPAQALPALASAVIGLLIIDPYLSLSFGFALSVAATAGIALWAPHVARVCEKIFTPALAKLASIPIAAQFACLPILVLFNPGAGAYAIPANMVAVPFAIGVTLVGVVALVAGALWAPLGVVFAWAASAFAWPIAWSAAGFAALPGAWVPWPAGLVGALLAGVVSAALVAATVVRRVRGWARLAGLVAACSMVAATPAVWGAQVTRAASAPDDWSIAACDVGQGDMLLLRTGRSSAIVIDSGPPGGGGAECLTRHSVDSVPLLVLTHPHADHDGGVRDLLAHADVGEAWVPAVGLRGERGTAARILANEGVTVRAPIAGAQVRVGDVVLEVWSFEPRGGNEGPNLNDASLVVRAMAGGLTVLALGDLENAGQRALLRELPSAVVVDVVKIPHHGSRRQDPGLAARISARFAVVSVGGDNTYGHPTTAALDLYRGTGARVLRTDECGDVDFVPGAPPLAFARCPQAVAGLAHGGTESGPISRGQPRGENLGFGGASPTGPGIRAGAIARHAGDRHHRRERPRGPRNGSGDAIERGRVHARGPPVGRESLAV